MALIGKIIAMTGTASLISNNGNQRDLRIGDSIQTADTIKTGAGVEVELQLANGQVVHIGAEQLIAFADELVDTFETQSLDSSVNLATIDSVVKALEEGKDLSDVVEDTAAGGSGSSSYGFGFVDLIRINDDLNNFRFAYEYGVPAPIEQALSANSFADVINQITGTGVGGVSIPPSISTVEAGTAGVADDNVNEGSNLVFNVAITGTSTTAVTYALNLADGTATGGSDYNNVLTNSSFSNGVTYDVVTGLITVPAGVTGFTVTVPTLTDSVSGEPIETLSLTIGGQTGNGGIIDNNSSPINTIPQAQFAIEDTVKVFSSVSGNAITVADVDANILTTTISVTHGVFNAIVGGGVTINGNDTGTVIITGTATQINAALDGASYTPASNYGGDISTLTVTTTDGSLTDIDEVVINVAAVADAPLLSVLTSVSTATPTTTMPESDGLTLQNFVNISTLDRTIASDIVAFEAGIESSSAIATSVSVVTNVAIGTVASGGVNTDEALRYTGYVYLEAGHTYTISGYRDDTIIVKVGGTSVFSSPSDNWGNFTATGYTPTTTGYYSIEIDMYNGNYIGSIDLNMSVDGATPVDLSSDNFNLYSTSTVITNSGINLGDFVAVSDGGYYPVATNNAASLSLTSITSSLVDSDGSELLTIAVSGISIGAILTDGTNFFQSSSVTNSVDVSSWNLGGLFVMPGTSALAGTDTILTVTSTATEASNGDLASTSLNASFAVSAATYQIGTMLDETLNGTADNDFIVGGSGINIITGGNGNDVLIGGIDSDSINGGAGADIILGGAADDVLTGGYGADVFKWSLADAGDVGVAASDLITDFDNINNGDQLDLRDLLQGETAVGAGANLDSYLHFEKQGADTVVHISSNGGFNGGYNSSVEVQTITLQNVDLIGSYANDQQVIQNLINNQNLITD